MTSDRPTPVGEHFDTVPMDPPQWDIDEQPERSQTILPGAMMAIETTEEKTI